MTELELAFRQEVAGHLDAHTAALTEVLRRLIADPLPPEVALLWVEVFAEHTAIFPVRAFFLDQRWQEVFVEEDGRRRWPGTVDPALLRLPGVYPRELLDRFQALAMDAQARLDLTKAASETIVEWFNLCWLAADGRSYPREAVIGLHDAERRLDLRRQVWIELS
jgi:hypothetical protein